MREYIERNHLVKDYIVSLFPDAIVHTHHNNICEIKIQQYFYFEFFENYMFDFIINHKNDNNNPLCWFDMEDYKFETKKYIIQDFDISPTIDFDQEWENDKFFQLSTSIDMAPMVFLMEHIPSIQEFFDNIYKLYKDVK